MSPIKHEASTPAEALFNALAPRAKRGKRRRAPVVTPRRPFSSLDVISAAAVLSLTPAALRMKLRRAPVDASGMTTLGPVRAWRIGHSWRIALPE